LKNLNAKLLLKNKNFEMDTRMAIRISKDGFNDDSESCRKEALGTDTKIFAWNSNNFKVNVLLALLETTAPVFVTLSVAIDFPVGHLAFLGAVSPFLAASTKLDGESTNFKAKGTVT